MVFSKTCGLALVTSNYENCRSFLVYPKNLDLAGAPEFETRLTTGLKKGETKKRDGQFSQAFRRGTINTFKLRVYNCKIND